MNASDVFRTRELFVFFRLQLVSEGGKQEAILLNFIWKSISSSACRELRIQTHTHTHTHRKILGNTHTHTHTHRDRHTNILRNRKQDIRTKQQQNWVSGGRIAPKSQTLLQFFDILLTNFKLGLTFPRLERLLQDTKSTCIFKIQYHHAYSRYNIIMHLQDTISPYIFKIQYHHAPSSTISQQHRLFWDSVFRVFPVGPQDRLEAITKCSPMCFQFPSTTTRGFCSDQFQKKKKKQQEDDGEKGGVEEVWR